jgi:hypothetical protein
VSSEPTTGHPHNLLCVCTVWAQWEQRCRVIITSYSDSLVLCVFPLPPLLLLLLLATSCAWPAVHKPRAAGGAAGRVPPPDQRLLASSHLERSRARGAPRAAGAAQLITPPPPPPPVWHVAVCLCNCACVLPSPPRRRMLPGTGLSARRRNTLSACAGGGQRAAVGHVCYLRLCLLVAQQPCVPASGSCGE